MTGLHAHPARRPSPQTARKGQTATTRSKTPPGGWDSWWRPSSDPRERPRRRGRRGRAASLRIVDGMADLTNVSDDSFQAEVLENEQPVLVDFWAPWCGPCRVVAPVLEEIANERENLRVVKLNVDENQRTAAQYNVMSIPTMILFKNGQPAKTIIGAYPKKRLEAELEPVLA